MTKHTLLAVLLILFFSCATEEKFFERFENTNRDYQIIYLDGISYNFKSRTICQNIWREYGFKVILDKYFQNDISFPDNNNEIEDVISDYYNNLVKYYTEIIDDIVEKNIHKNIILIGTNELTVILPKIYFELKYKNNIAGIVILYRHYELNELGIEEQDVNSFLGEYKKLYHYQSIPGLFFIETKTDLNLLREIALQGSHSPVKTIYFDYETTNEETMDKIVIDIKQWIEKNIL